MSARAGALSSPPNPKHTFPCRSAQYADAQKYAMPPHNAASRKKGTRAQRHIVPECHEDAGTEAKIRRAQPFEMKIRNDKNFRFGHKEGRVTLVRKMFENIRHANISKKGFVMILYDNTEAGGWLGFREEVVNE
jgi:hypothetical protein